MSITLPNKLMLGVLLLNLVITPTQTVALELTTGTSPVHELTIVEPNLLAQQSPRPRRIRFQRGASSAVVENSVVRGTRDTYLLGARAGQRMTLNITSLENNAVFDIVAPNGEMIHQETTSRSFRLPSTGDYQVIVGGTRGNASYRLRVEIK